MGISEEVIDGKQNKAQVIRDYRFAKVRENKFPSILNNLSTTLEVGDKCIIDIYFDGFIVFVRLNAWGLLRMASQFNSSTI